MTGALNANDRGPSAHELVVVEIKDAVNLILAGRGDVSYQSPPQPRDEALMLVALLLGRGEPLPADEARWTCPIAGGQRTVALRPAPRVGPAGRTLARGAPAHRTERR